MSMSVDGLVSGLDTTALITQLIQAEAGQQTALKSRLSATNLAASAYRTVNTTFAAVRAAAEAMSKPEAWSSTKATSSSADVKVTSTASAAAGSLTFTVDQLASAHAIFRTDPSWTSATSPAGFSSLDVYAADGTTRTGTVTVGGSQSLTDVADAINASPFGLSAAVVKTGGAFTLQVTARKTGAAQEFSLQGAGTFLINAQGADAQLTIGTSSTFSVTSDTNTFTALPGLTITVGRQAVGTEVTVGVAADPDAAASKMQALVDAVNSALTQVKTYTNNSAGSTAALRGDYAVTQFTGQLLDAVSFAVDADGSPSRVGLELTRNGTISFDKAKFLAALTDTPELARRMVTGTDGPPAVAGIADRLLTVAKAASDAATGSLVKLAEGQDSLAKDITDRIAAWDLRLAKRKEMLTRQFSAMETALSSLKNQSTWLAGQLNSLPSGS